MEEDKEDVCEMQEVSLRPEEQEVLFGLEEEEEESEPIVQNIKVEPQEQEREPIIRTVSSSKKGLHFDEIRVEYIKENDFAPRPPRKYAPRMIHKIVERHGEGYKSASPQAQQTVVDEAEQLKRKKEIKVKRKEWLRQIRRAKKIQCPIKGCVRNFFSIAGLVAHYQRCNGHPDDILSCDGCHKTFHAEWLLKSHKLECKRLKDNKLLQDDSNLKATTETEDKFRKTGDVHGTSKNEKMGEGLVTSSRKRHHISEAADPVITEKKRKFSRNKTDSDDDNIITDQTDRTIKEPVQVTPSGDLEETPLARRRGRPPKIKTGETSQNVDKTPSQPRSGKKTRRLSVETDDDLTPVTKTKGRSSKQDIDDIDDDGVVMVTPNRRESLESETVVKSSSKRRGRPPKQKPKDTPEPISGRKTRQDKISDREDEGEITSLNREKFITRSGRKSKKFVVNDDVSDGSGNEEEEEDDNLYKTPIVKRQKQTKTDSHDTSKDDLADADRGRKIDKMNNDGNKIQSKKRTGRKRKELTEEESEEDSETLDTDSGIVNKLERVESHAPKKRGRPKKNTSGPNELKSKIADKSNESDEDDDITEQPVVRKRGRPKKVIGVKSGVRGKKSLAETGNVKSSLESNKDNGGTEITCVHCSSAFSTDQIYHHMLYKHQLIWSAEAPEGVEHVTQIIKKLGYINCKKCGKKLKHQASHTYHVPWCGIEDQKAACEICGKMLKPRSMKHHVRNSHGTSSISPPQKPDVEEEEEIVEKTGSGRVRRKAASKALNHLQDIALEMEEQRKLTDQKDIKMRYTSGKGRDITEAVKKDWTEQEKKHGIMTCKFEGCDFETKKTTAMRRHFHRCEHGPAMSEVYTCKKCKKTFHNEDTVRSHVESKHKWSDSEDETKSGDEVYDDSDADPDVIIDNESDEEEDDGSSGDEEVSDSGSEEESYRSTTSGPVRIRRKSRCNNSMLEECLDWTMDWYIQHDYSQLFPQWKCHIQAWSLLSPGDQEIYIPEHETSPEFTIKETSPHSAQKLKRFQASQEAGVLNTGGPVWALAWCPTPLGMKVKQHIAVYSHRNVTQQSTISKTISGPGLIQIWDCDLLHAEPNKGIKMVLGIAHNHGAVWALKWCPVGAYQKSQSPNPQATVYSRLGLLLAACSDGTLNIYSVPHADEIKLNSDTLPIYKPESVATLHMSFTPELDKACQCTSVDWQWAEGCGRVMAGFMDGTVSIWDLNTESVLLHTQTFSGSLPTDIYFPIQTFHAHLLPTAGVAFCQKNPLFVGTAGQDRNIRLWDLRNVESPVNSVQKSLHTCVLWPTNWPITIAAGDDCYCLEHNCSFICESGYFGLNVRPLTVHNSTAWDISFSDWMNGLVGVDSAGNVMSMMLPYMLLSHKHSRITERRKLLVSTEIHTEPADLSTQSDKQTACEKCKTTPGSATCVCASSKKSSTQSVPAQDDAVATTSTDMATNDSESVPHSTQLASNRMVKAYDTATIIYSDFNVDHRIPDGKKYSFGHNLPPEKLSQPPLQSLHRVSWNPNLNWHSWIAAAGQAGLVRLMRLKPSSSEKADKLFKQAAARYR